MYWGVSENMVRETVWTDGGWTKLKIRFVSASWRSGSSYSSSAQFLKVAGGTFCVPFFSDRWVVPHVISSQHTDLFGETAYGILQHSQTGEASAFMIMIAMWKKFSFHLGALLRISKGFNLLSFSPTSYCILFFARLLNQSVQCVRSVLIPGEWREWEEVIVFL